MNWEQAFQQNFFKLSLLLVAMGFLTTLGELLFAMHLTESQSIGLYATFLGAVLAIHGFFDLRARKGLSIAFFILALFGVIGTYKHYEARQLKGELSTLQQAMSGDSDSTVNRIISPPLMAPLSISGLSMFAIAILLSVKDEEELSEA